MRCIQNIVQSAGDASRVLSAMGDQDLVLAFGAVPFFEGASWWREGAGPVLAGCSTAGEIAGHDVHDGRLILTGLRFERADSRVAVCSARLGSMEDSFDAGTRLARQLPLDGLAGVMLLGTGVAINGSALLAGVQSVVGTDRPVSGGLAADGGAFRETWTLGPDGAFADQLLLLGFYGEAMQVGHGSFGGWSSFGPARRVTHCEENVLFALDGERALDIYKRYLGDYAAQLPASGLLFPFEMLDAQGQAEGVIRTILGVDETAGSLTLAGDIDPDGYLRLMHASAESLIEGAGQAAALVGGDEGQARFALLVSCIGRKLVLGERVDEEVEAVAQILGARTTLAGFYSNGEIGVAGSGHCRLFNQTMTITVLGER